MLDKLDLLNWIGFGITLLLMGFTAVYLFMVGRLQKNVNSLAHLASSRRGFHGRNSIALFNALKAFPLTRPLTKRIALQYTILFPKDSVSIKQRTVSTVLMLLCGASVAIVIATIVSPSFTTLIAVVVSIFGFGSVYLRKKITNLTSEIREQFIEFIAVFRSFYLNKRSIEEAMREAVAKSPALIKEHVKIMLDIILAKDYKGKLSRYCDKIPINAMRIFLFDAIVAQKKGDPMVGERTNLMRHLDSIQESLYSERQQEKMEQHAFSGIYVVILVPILCVGRLREWAVKNVEGMGAYYNGVQGLLMVVAIFLGTALVYVVATRIQVMYQPALSDHLALKFIYRIPFVHHLLECYEYKNYGRTMKKKKLLKQVGESLTPELMLIKQTLMGITAFVGVILLSFFLIAYNKTISLAYVTDSQVATADATEESYAKMKQAVVDVTFAFKDAYEEAQWKEELKAFVEKEYFYTLRPLEQEMVINECIRRVISYNSSIFHWWYLLLAQMAAFIGFLLPYYLVVMRAPSALIAMEDEVLHFKIVVMMLMNIDSMTVDEILEWLYSFSRIFRTPLRKCLNALPKGEQKALRELKKIEPLPSFQHLVDDLIACDKVTMTQAFSNLRLECKDYQARRAQLTLEFIDKRSAIIELVCMIPTVLIMVGYLVIPFLTYGMESLTKVSVNTLG